MKGDKMKKSAMFSTVKDLLKNYTEDSFVSTCADYVSKECGCPVGTANLNSWRDCFRFLQENLSDPFFQDYHVLFEYLMVDSEKRPDVILLTKSQAVILEFKQKNEILKKDVVQVNGYKNSLTRYHQITAELDLDVLSYLVFTLPINEQSTEIDILQPSDFTTRLKKDLDPNPMDETTANRWYASIFEVLKNIADATAQLFLTGDLPNIKSIREGDIADSLAAVNEIIDKPGQKSIVFLQGVPGAGKTLVGLKTVHDQYRVNPKSRPIYLSGNGPLVNILQTTLTNARADGKAFIRDMHVFKRHHRHDIPINNVIVFDEAQRAWDAQKNGGISEPESLLRILDRKPYVTLICLIGDGQAIYKGEEVGMPLWQEALNKFPDWKVYLPPTMKNKIRGEIDDRLFLDTSIRNDFINVSPLVEAILDCRFEEARRIYKQLQRQGLAVYTTKNKEQLPKIVQYVKSNNPNDHVGLLVSSYVNNRQIFPTGYRNSYIKAIEAGNWYFGEAPRLQRAASEFLIQGIELEWPIVTFGGDFYLQNGKWVIEDYVRAKGSNAFRDFETIIRNVYRVLLTRSRKGMYIYVPASVDLKLLETWNTIRKIFE